MTTGLTVCRTSISGARPKVISGTVAAAPAAAVVRTKSRRLILLLIFRSSAKSSERELHKEGTAGKAASTGNLLQMSISNAPNRRVCVNNPDNEREQRHPGTVPRNIGPRPEQDESLIRSPSVPSVLVKTPFQIHRNIAADHQTESSRAALTTQNHPDQLSPLAPVLASVYVRVPSTANPQPHMKRVALHERRF